MTAKQAWNRTDDQEAYEERAAIMEYDGGLNRQEAERKAAEAHRQAMPVIAGVVDEFRKVFGRVRVTHAAENGLELGRTLNIRLNGVRSHTARLPKGNLSGGAK